MRSGLRSTLPVGDRRMLVRERLLDRLRARWFVPVVVVTAPAGYGKTTLLTQAIAANATAPVGIDCWLACGPDMATASALGAQLCRAVDAPIPTARAGPGDMVAAAVEAIWRRSPQQVALTVDDVHEIPNGSEAANLVASVVASLPANGHVVLAGRGRPPLPIARLEVEGRVVRLEESDLAFTDEEAAEFAALRGVPRSKVARSGGWPALAELSASARSDAIVGGIGPNDDVGRNDHVGQDYIGQEVLSPHPAVRRGLALLAHIGPFDDDLAQAVLGPDVDVSEVVAGIPLVTVGPGGERTLHSLWQSLLAHEVTSAEVANARRRAAQALLRRGQATEAVRLLIDAQAWEELTEAIVGALSAARPPVPVDVLAEWLGRLPADVQGDLGGRLLGAVAASDTDPGDAWERLEECTAAFRGLGHQAGEVACLVHLGELAWRSERPERLTGVAGRVFELEAGGCEDAVPLACIARALIFDIQNDSQRVLTELDRIPPGSLSGGWRDVVGALRSSALMQLGHAEEALQTAEQALVHARPMYAATLEGSRLHALWFQGRIDDVLDALPEEVRRVRETGFRHQIALVTAQCALACALQGRSDEAAGHLTEARADTTSPPAPVVDMALSLADAALAVDRGDETAAHDLLATALAHHPVDEGLSAAPQQRSLALVYVLLPASRPTWDRAELGPAFAVARDLARAVVAVREQGTLPADTPPLPETTVVQAHLPRRWVAELGVAAVATGRDDGTRLLEEMRPAARAAVADLAAHTDGPLAKAAASALSLLAFPPTSRLELRLLGPLELWRDGALVQASDWRRGRVRALLAHLVLHGTVSRRQLAQDLWPALDTEGQVRNLRVTLSRLLKVLEPERGPRGPSFFVRQHGNHLTFHPGDRLAADVWELDRSCEQVAEADRQGSPSAVLAHALRAMELWRGEATELASEPWAVAPVAKRQLRFATVATRAGELLLARGDIDRARALAEQTLAMDLWLEAAHRLVVAAHRAGGDHLAARRALGRYRDAIREHGLSPDEMTLMVERLLDDLPP